MRRTCTPTVLPVSGTAETDVRCEQLGVEFSSQHSELHVCCLCQARSQRNHSDSGSTVSSDVSTKPPPPPVALKPSFLARGTPTQEPTSNTEDPASRSFLGKVKAFEQMDNLARAQRMLELQEAEHARVSVCVSLSLSLSHTRTHTRTHHLASVPQSQ